MKSNNLNRWISVLLCLVTVMSLMPSMLTASARYADDFDGTYDDLHCAEDDCDCLEPENNRFAVVSPDSGINTYNSIVFTGTYEQVQDYFKENDLTDGMPVIPPTKLKAEKFMRYTPYNGTDVIATVNGRQVTAYQVAANAIMSGSSAEYMPVCIAFTKALGDVDYLESLRSGKLTPMMYVSGPIARQLGVDNSQGMTTEECNIAIARFMELALINLAGLKRTNAFGSVQPLVFSENEEACLNIGWEPHQVEEGYELNDSTVTAATFSMWGNNVTPATDLPEEIMKVLAWDITEKNLGGLGGASTDENADTHRLIFITESVAAALAAKYRTKGDLENALIENARRPLWMRAYACHYSGEFGSSVYDACEELKTAEKEDAGFTSSPPWLSGITYAEIDTVATMTKGNTDIIITGDSSRNKTQVMPGGVQVTGRVDIPAMWDELMTSMSYKPLESFNLSERDNEITPPASVPPVLTNGTYRILDPSSGSTYLNRPGRVYYDSSSSTLHYYAQGASSKDSIVLDPAADSDFIAYLTHLGANSSFRVYNGRLRDVTIRFSSNASKMNNNTVALTDKSFSGISITLHANNIANSNTAGGLAKDGASVVISDTVISFAINLDGDPVMGDATDADFVKLSGTTVTVDPDAKPGARAIIGTPNANGTYRTLTFVNGGDGTYSVTYNTANTLSNTLSTVWLKGSINEAFLKTGNDDIVSLTKELTAGTYKFKVYKSGTDEWYGNSGTITDTANRWPMTSDGSNCTLNTEGGVFEFKYEISTGRLSVYKAASDQAAVPSSITAEKIKVDTSSDRTSTLKVSLNTDEQVTFAHLRIESKLPISGIESENDCRFDGETGEIIVFNSDGGAVDRNLFSILYTFDKLEEDGEYPVDISVIELVSDNGTIDAKAYDGAVIVDNTYRKGDVTRDGEVTNADLIVLARYLVNLVTFNDKQKELADYNEDGTISNSDLVQIARALVAA